MATIEVVSPGNKDNRARAASFRAKILECIESGLHILLVDVHTPTRSARDFGAEIARELGSSADLEHSDRAVTSFEVIAEPWQIRLYRTSLAVGNALPEGLLFLESDRPVRVPLESTYAEAFDCLPKIDQIAVG